MHLNLVGRAKTVNERLKSFEAGATLVVTSHQKEYFATLTCKQGRCKGAPVLAVDFWKDGTCADDVGVHQCKLVTPSRIVSNRIHVDDAIGVWFSSDRSV